MKPIRTLCVVAALAGLLGVDSATASMSDVLARAHQADWKAFDPENTLYMKLPRGGVVIALAPQFAPRAVAAIKAFVRAHAFDRGAIIRAQDDYVVQWAIRDDKTHSPAKIPAEFDRARDAGFVALADPDTYAPQVGFDGGFPAARDASREWLVHCYGMVGVARDAAPDSGDGSELYAVIGQSPRNLDRNVTLVGRIVHGMELLSTLTRGTEALGFYAKPEERMTIESIRVAADIPVKERVALMALRDDSATFAKLVADQRMRKEPWYVNSPGHIGVCNVPLPVR